MNGNSQDPEYTNMNGNTQVPEYTNMNGNTQDPEYTNMNGNSQNPEYTNMNGNTQDPEYTNTNGNTQDPEYTNINGNIQDPEYTNMNGNNQDPEYTNIDSNIQDPEYTNIQDPETCSIQSTYGTLHIPAKYCTTTKMSIKVYKSRFWIMGMFSLISFIHSTVWATWGPISEAMEAAFTGWDSSTVALLTNWGSIMFAVWVVPASWVAQCWGLKKGTLASAVMITVATVLRSIPSGTPTFTVLCHVCAILQGISSAFITNASPLVASVWFPVKERTTAMGVMMGMIQLGVVGSYVEPLLVQVPSDTITITQVQQQVMTMLYIGAGVCGTLLLAVIVYFPDKPPSPPSLSSTTTRVQIAASLKPLLTNTNFLLTIFSCGVCTGPPIAWMTVLNYSIIPLGFHQDSVMWIGIVSVVISSITPVISGRINDLYQRHIKVQLVVLMTATTACFFWFLLITYEVIPVSTWQVYVSVVGATSFSYATMPLFCEAAIDLAYPVPEILVNGLLMAIQCIAMSLFLLVLNFPEVGYKWMAYTQVLTSSLTILPLFCFDFQTTRADIDN